MDKKTIIAVVICVLILVFWGQIARNLGLIKESPPPEQIQSITDTLLVADTARYEPPPVRVREAAPLEEKPPATIEPTDSLIPEQLITVSTPLYQLVFSNYGGGLKKISLRKYTYNGQGNVILADGADKIVPDFEAAEGAYQGQQLVFSCDARDIELRSGDQPKKIEFVYDGKDGGRIVKSFTINPDHYHIDFDLTIESIETFGLERSYHLVWGITPPPTEKNLKDDYGHYKVVALMDDFRNFDDFDNGRMNVQIPGITNWVGLRSKYFAEIMISRNREGSGILARGTKQKMDIGGKAVDARQLSAAIEMPISNYGTVSDSYTLYVGPIKYEILREYNVGLEELSSLGWVIIKPFSIAIIWLLPKIYSVIPNYGIVVMVFALLIKLITYPLSRKQNLAMARMKELQPKMKAMQEKFKNDPQRLNKEIMKLYKEAGANPLSGCLPMLPQMPLFFALFTVFRTTIQFRGASFMGWITDLSTPDPYYILPVIMVVVMFIQQKLTMTDPKNKLMVYAMPLFFGWISINFPAGLVVYWTSFSLISFAETILIRRTTASSEAVEVKK